MSTPVGGTFDIQVLPDVPSGIKFESPEFQMWINLVNRNVRKIFMQHSTLTPSVVNANSTSDQTFTVNGLITLAHVWIVPPDLASGLFIGYSNCPANNTLKIRFVNITAGPLTPASGLYHVTALFH